EDELGLLPCEADLDVAGRELRGELDGSLRKQVEELEAQVRGERVAQPLRDLGRPLVTELREPLQVLLESFQDDRQVHCDITMTSLVQSVKCHQDAGMIPSPRHRETTTGGRFGRPSREERVKGVLPAASNRAPDRPGPRRRTS